MKSVLSIDNLSNAEIKLGAQVTPLTPTELSNDSLATVLGGQEITNHEGFRDGIATAAEGVAALVGTLALMTPATAPLAAWGIAIVGGAASGAMIGSGAAEISDSVSFRDAGGSGGSGGHDGGGRDYDSGDGHEGGGGAGGGGGDSDEDDQY